MKNDKINISEMSPLSLTSHQKISMRDETRVDSSFNIDDVSPTSVDNIIHRDSKLDIDLDTNLERNPEEEEDVPKKFAYLEENNELQTLFTFCVPDSTEQIKVNLLFYKINNTCSLATYKGEYDDVDFENVPFIMFGGIEKDSQFELPYFTYDCVSAKNDDDIETNFRNECILNAVRISGSDVNYATDAYKGFIMHADEIFVVIDTDILFSDDFLEEDAMDDAMDAVVTPNMEIGEPMLEKGIEKWMNGGTPMEDSSGGVLLKWALVDEIVFERNVDGVKIEEGYVGFLEKYRFLWELEYNGHVLPFPYAVYGIKSSVENKYEIEEETDDHEQIEHNVLGLWYLFLADSSILSGEQLTKYKKYACFITKPKFYDEINDSTINLDAESTEKPEKDEEKMNIGEELLTTSAIYFKHDGKIVWGVKYEEQFCPIIGSMVWNFQ